MATRTFWVQLEQHYWDTMPNNKDRMTNQTAWGMYGSIESPTGKDLTDTLPTTPGRYVEDNGH